VSAPRALGYAALALGLAAPFAGSPYGSARGRIDVDELAGVVARGEDHVEAIDLAQRIRARQPGLRVIDLRTNEELDGYAIPGAERHAIDALSRLHPAPGDTLVLVSQAGAHAAQAWVLLRALGWRQVYFLRGGMDEWRDEVMRPELAADADEHARRAFEVVADLSRYFGGAPGIGPARGDGGSGAPPGGERKGAVRPRRYGC